MNMAAIIHDSNKIYFNHCSPAMIETLPDELLLKIFRLLDPCELPACFAVSQSLRRISQDNTLMPKVTACRNLILRFIQSNQPKAVFDGAYHSYLVDVKKPATENIAHISSRIRASADLTLSEIESEIHKCKEAISHIYKKEGLNQKMAEGLAYMRQALASENWCSAMLQTPQILENFLASLSFEELCLLDMPSEKETSLLSLNLQRVFIRAWKKHLPCRTTETGLITINSGDRFSLSAFTFFLQAIASEKTIQGIVICASLEDAQWHSLAERLESSLQIKELILQTGSQLPEATFARLAAAIAKSEITNLRFTDFLIDDGSLAILTRELGPSVALESLSLSTMAANVKGFHELASLLERCKSLKKLSLTGWRDNEIQVIFETLNKSNLEALILDNGTLTTISCKTLTENLANNSKLKELEFHRTKSEGGREAAEQMRVTLRANKFLERLFLP